MDEYEVGPLLEVVDGFMMVLRDQVVVYANDFLIATIRQTRESMIGARLDEVLEGEFLRGIGSFAQRVEGAGGELVSEAITIDDPALGKVELSMRGRGVGDLVYMAAQRPEPPSDVAEQRLLELEDRLTALLSLTSNAGIGLMVVEAKEDGTVRTRTANEHVTRMLSMDRDEVLSRSPIEFIHKDDRAAAQRLEQRLMGGELTTTPIEVRVVDSNGRTVHVRLSISKLATVGENTFLVFIEDMTFVKEALEQQNRLVRAIDLLDETVVLSDDYGNIVYANQMALRNSGYTFEEVVGKPITLFGSPEATGPIGGSAMEEFLERGWWRGDYMACDKEGKRYPVEVIGSLVRDERDEINSIIVVSRKIEERQRFEAQLFAAQNASETLQEFLEQGLNPRLEEALGILDGLATGDTGAEGGGAAVSRVAASLATALRRSRTALRELPSGKGQEPLRPMDLRSVLDQTLPRLREAHGPQGFTVTLEPYEGTVEPVVMANDMLGELIQRLFRVLVGLFTRRGEELGISIGTVAFSDLPGEGSPEGPEDADGADVGFAEVSITGSSLRVPRDLRLVLSSREMPTRGPLPEEFEHAVEVSRLLVFLFKGQIHVEEDEGHEPRRSRVVLLLPLAEIEMPPRGEAYPLYAKGRPGPRVREGR